MSATDGLGAFPRVRVSGGPRERGRAYGAGAADRIATSIRAYEEVFRAYAGWSWSQVRREAARYEAPIAAFDDRYVEEMRGIAEGAGVDLEDILSINVRTEVMFAAKAREAGSAVDGSGPRQGECTAFSVVPEASASGHTLIGQNWDWLLHCFDTVVVLEAEQDEGPNFVSVVEAGLLAKTGMNSSGLGVVTNALVTDDDRGEPAVPYHVLLRAFMDAETRALVGARAVSVWLRAALDVLLQRTAGRTHRPLLNRGDPRAILGRLIELRYPVYAEADLTVDSLADQSHEQMASRILEALQADGRAFVAPVPVPEDR